MNETDDHQHLLDSVRDAMEQHHSEAEPSHQPTDHEHHNAEQRENSQAATDMGLQVANLMNQEERQRSTEQSKNKRDSRGRFASSTSSDNGSASADLALNVAAEATVAGPPSSWRPEARAEWEHLPQHVRDAIAKREAEVSQGFSQYRDRTQSAAQIESMLAPRRQVFQQYGLNDAQAIERLMVVSDGLARNPVGTLAFLAQQFGIRPEHVFPAVQSAPSHELIESYVRQRVQTAQAQAEVQRFEAKAPEHYG
jgi:hypothetical protein